MSSSPFRWTGSGRALFDLWASLLPDALPAMLALASVALSALTLIELWRLHRGGEVPARQRFAWLLLVLVGALVVGYRIVLRSASLFDDAYISFRFARNLANGDGLVWNLGERVEGYSNFLWTFLIGALSWASPWDPPSLGLALSLGCFGLNLLLVAALSWRLSGGWLAPGLALVLLASSRVFTDYGSTGMETGLCAALVLAAAVFLARDGSVVSAAAAGSFLILATLNRQDHSLFYIARLADKELEQVREDLRWFDSYYFEQTPDRSRRRQIERWLKENTEAAAPPAMHARLVDNQSID